MRRSPELKTFLDVLENADIDVVDWKPTQRPGKGECWEITLSDPDVAALTIRYEQYAHQAGLESHTLASRPGA